MLNIFIVLIFIIVGLINFMPIVGALSAAHLAHLYDIKINDSNIEVLLRHRAVLLGIVGGLLIYAAFNPALQTLAWVIGMLSMVSFIAVCYITATPSDALMRIIRADSFAILLLFLIPFLRRL